MNQDNFVDEALLNRVKTWRNYFAAKVGFRNHWYAASYSRELREGEVQARKILGEDILFRRIRGRVFAMKDRCITAASTSRNARVPHRGNDQLLVPRLHVPLGGRSSLQHHWSARQPAHR